VLSLAGNPVFTVQDAERCRSGCPQAPRQRPSCTSSQAVCAAASAPRPGGVLRGLCSSLPGSHATFELKSNNVIFDHHQPGRDRRPVPCHQPLRRQSAADAGRISRLSGTDRAQWSRRTRAHHGAMGHAVLPVRAHAGNEEAAAKLEAKGKPVDFKELLRMEPDGGTTNICKQADEQTEHWHIHYAGVRVGLIQQRSGAPPSSDQSEWHCGF
jgi:hypothetical protein